MSAKVKGGDKALGSIKKIADTVKETAVSKLRVGFLEGATYPDGTSVGEVAAFNEYGRMVKVKGEDGSEESYYQLPRPFFRNMIAEKKAGWPAAIAALMRTSGYNAHFALLQAGEGIAGQLRQSITDFSSPPLAESTIKAKGFSKPLVDTGHMLNSVDYEVI